MGKACGCRRAPGRGAATAALAANCIRLLGCLVAPMHSCHTAALILVDVTMLRVRALSSAKARLTSLRHILCTGFVCSVRVRGGLRFRTRTLVVIPDCRTV